MGLFGKSKKELIEWQKLVYYNQPIKQIYPESVLIKQSQNVLQDSIRIIGDCEKIINETTNPDTFFSRYDLVIQKCKIIVNLSKYVKLKGENPKTLYNKLIENKQEEIYHMIVRYWGKTFTEAENLKTDSGKIKRYEKFYHTLEQFKDEMNEENIRYYTNKYETAVSRLKKQAN